MDEIKITIIGAGIIGLSIAAELSKSHQDIVVLEKNTSFGQETSSRNSEVIHAGLYYPPDSLKLKLCLEGADQLYALCQEASIPFRQLGKIIVAQEASELFALEELFKKAQSYGAKDLTILDQKEIARLEPQVLGLAGIYSPRTGIIDTHALMKHLARSAQSRGVDLVYCSQVNLLQKESSGFIVGIQQDDYRVRSRLVINCAGLYADQIASLVGIDIDQQGYRLHLCKGDYFSYAKPSPVSRLIYPLPHTHYLGVHATLDLGSRLRFGPDAEYTSQIDYRVAPDKADKFYQAARKLINHLEREALVPDMAGIRPKLQGPGDSFRDFIIREESALGLDGLINLIGIESPGLTCCLAIARMVAGLVAEILKD
ncbi:MAG: NAD(P)/FAD-dependent oxidoreductase [bacterium]|nr:NAD(P)/FAD-dependent oxidoreductase [bacterium]